MRYFDYLREIEPLQDLRIYYTNGFQTFIIDGLGYPARLLYAFHTEEDLGLLIKHRSRGNITDFRVNDEITNRDYQKMAILDYFDALMVGLTATPARDITSNDLINVEPFSGYDWLGVFSPQAQGVGKIVEIQIVVFNNTILPIS